MQHLLKVLPAPSDWPATEAALASDLVVGVCCTALPAAWLMARTTCFLRAAFLLSSESWHVLKSCNTQHVILHLFQEVNKQKSRKWQARDCSISNKSYVGCWLHCVAQLASVVFPKTTLLWSCHIWIVLKCPLCCKACTISIIGSFAASMSHADLVPVTLSAPQVLALYMPIEGWLLVVLLSHVVK